jgi:predicted dehydrogenase
MGRGHFEQYQRLMEEGEPVKLVALCDTDPKKFRDDHVQGGNLGELGKLKYDFSQYTIYSDFEDMIASEQMDFVDIVIPTYLHSQYACRAINAGFHVFCEKPMALNPAQCNRMIEASNATGKKLMIGQCLRFWPEYEELKRCISGGEFGAPISAYFFRGGGPPLWSYQDWYMDENRSGGCLLDQHIHDVDMVNYLFGLPLAVSSVGRNVHPGAGYDAVSTHYRFEGDFIVNAQDDWSMVEVPFSMAFRVNMERGALVFENNALTIYPVGKASVNFEGGEMGYYKELK